ncbi:MAG: hypothetical protein R3309_11760 [Reinekea sp.]|nr:hypothetical protein [Reinekea sp.]
MRAKTRMKWQALIEQQSSSGLSISEFCRKKGLTSSNFYKYRLALSETSPSTSNQRFVKLKRSVVNTAGGAILQLDYGQTQLRIADSVSPTWLAELLKALA